MGIFDEWDEKTPVDLRPDVLDDVAAENLAVAMPPDEAFEETSETPVIFDPCQRCRMVRLARVSDGVPPPKAAPEAWALGACIATSSNLWTWCQVRGLFNGEIDWNRRSRPDPMRREGERRRPASKPFVE